MSKKNVLIHCAYIGYTGYNVHTRNFVRSLAKYSDHTIKVRNFTVGDSWNGYNRNAHDGEPYLNDVDRKVLYYQTLWNTDRKMEEYAIYDNNGSFVPDVNIVFLEVNHHYYYQKYTGYNIAYTVWESTEYPSDFFEIIKTYDELWVPTEWQKQISIKQGYPAEKIKVVREGVDGQFFFPMEYKSKQTDKFSFLMVGRWDYRKNTTEVIRSFCDEFKDDTDVELILSVDNKFSVDGLSTTSERLSHYGLYHPNIKIVTFNSFELYLDLLRSSNVFLSCALSEGWNLPLIEAMACGIPSIYSNNSGQLEFTKNKGIPIRTVGEIPASHGFSWANLKIPCVGNYYIPDMEELKIKMRTVYTDYDVFKKRAHQDSIHIRNEFNWNYPAKYADGLLHSIDLKSASNMNETLNFNHMVIHK